MLEIVLHRVSYALHATFGVLTQDNVPICVALEDPWLDNKKNVSCIPIGVYEAQRHTSRLFGNTFVVTGVEGRSGILFHAGNWAGKRGVWKGPQKGDTQGCILPGTRFGVPSVSNGDMGVLNSREALKKFLRRLRGVNEFSLVIE